MARAETSVVTRWICALALAALPLRAPEAQGTQPGWFERERSFWFMFENDAFGGTSDSSYTNGIRVGWNFAAGGTRLGQLARALSLEGLADKLNLADIKLAELSCISRGSRVETRPCTMLGFALTQTMYTPSNIIDTKLQVDDRPYAGNLYASVIINTLRPGSQTSTELQLGVVGPAARAEDTQSLAHWTWASGSEKPRGWRHQLANRPQLAIVNNWQRRLLERCVFVDPLTSRPMCNGTASEKREFDVTSRYEAALGTHMTRASAGAIARYGRGFPDAVALTRIPTTRQMGRQNERGAQAWWNVFLAGDMRYVLRNALITGTSADKEPGRFGAERTVSARRLVGEASAGFAVGWRSTMLSYQLVMRQKEHEPTGGSHVFGAVAFSLFTPAGSR